MERWIAVAFIFAGFLRVAGAQTTLTIRIYNPAHLRLEELTKAQDEAAYILGSAGVQTTWVTCISPGKCSQPPSVWDVVVRLAPDSVFPKKDTTHRWILGRSVAGHGRSADYIEVYRAPIQKLVSETKIASTDEVIGAVIAHEVGHLFLGSRHSRSGLMTACWGPRELELLVQCRLKFDQFEKVKIERQFGLQQALQQQEASVFARNQAVW